MENIITWDEVYTDFINHFPNVNSVDYRPYMPLIIYIWLEDGREITYNYRTKRKRDEKRGTWERWFNNGLKIM